MKDTGEEPIRPVVGYEDLYTVSSSGIVTTIKTGIERKAVRKLDGYMTLLLWRGNRPKCVRIHRLVAEAFLGPVPAGTEVNHKDGDKGNNRVENLEYITRSQNMKHAMDHGMYPIGERHPYAKLTERQVIEIRERHASGEGCRHISRTTNIAYSVVYGIISRKSWKRVIGGETDSRTELVIT